MINQELSTLTDNFEEQKHAHFADIAVRVMPAMRLHKDQGLWERVPNKQGELQRDWGNVTEHCLVEAARVDVWAETLHLPKDVCNDLIMAAALHDFYKNAEIKKLRENNTSWEAYADAQVEAQDILEQKKFPERQIELATSVGHETLQEAERLAKKPNLAPTETAWLVMHYVDDYTIDSNWVQPAVEENGLLLNDFDRRMQRNKENAQPGGKYYGINQAGIEHLGELTYDAQERVGHLVENRLAALITEQNGVHIEPKLLPEFIDQKLTQKIAAS